jgi:methanogenic corrinoid protein MtbC1
MKPTAPAARPRGDGDAAVEAVWSMGAVCRATGLSQHTLRVWERRFRFPAPVRLPSGHRRYPGDQVERLRLIASAIAAGHRASTVVPLGPGALQSMLAAQARIEAGPGSFVPRIVALVRAFDRASLVRELQRTVAEIGTRAFLHDRVVPLVEAVGAEWAAGTLDVRNEHFLSEVLIGTLRALREPLEGSTPSRTVLLTTLPGEEHAVGLQMAALEIALAGRNATVLGTQTPPDEIVAAARTLHPVAVGLTVTRANASARTSREIGALARRLPAGVRLWLGGAGCRAVIGLARGVQRMPSLGHLARALAALPAV